MPFNIIYDFGLLFVGYLRGSSASTILLAELMYDVLATLTMFVRLFVQNIRFLLMFVAYIELFELIELISIEDVDFLNRTNEEYKPKKYTFTVDEAFYFLVISLPTYLIKYLYQLIHLIFTITSHFAAYLALVF